VRRAVLAVCCALLLVLAGCSVGFRGPTDDLGREPTVTPTDIGPATPTATPTAATPSDMPTATATATPTTTATPTPTNPQGMMNPGGLLGDDTERIAVRGGRLPVDATLVYDRTRTLLATEAPHPDTVQLLDTTANTTRPPEFQRLLGLERNVSEVEAAAFVIGPRTVYLNRNVTDRPAFTEHVLAHEFTHTVQFRRGYIGRVQAATASGPDGRFASTAVIEGAATYAQDRYWQTHIANRTAPGERPSVAVTADYRESTGAARYAFAPYRFGYRYANRTLDSPASLPTIYRDPPRTSEQVLHPGVEEGPVPLRVRLRNEREEVWQETFAPPRSRIGEAFLRVALSTELDDERAAHAAAGWGNDTRIAFNNESGARGYAWVIRFDDAGNASQFDDAVADYLRERTGSRSLADDRTGRQWTTTLDGRSVAYRLRRTDDRTAVLLLGTPAFVDPDTTTVRETDGAVVVATDGENQSTG
jgi:hypothetical protein